MAKYIRGIGRSQPMLLPAAVDDYVSAESPVRAIDAFVDELRLEGLGFATRTATSAGRSSHDPAVLLKLYLWGYLKRSRSSRALEDACRSKLSAIWLSGNLRPDHSTISDFRKRNATTLGKIFGEFNLICIQAGLFGRELVAIDGIFVKAVNSRARSFTKGKLTKLLAGIDEAVERYLGELDRHDSEKGEKGEKGELIELIELIRSWKRRPASA
jgi:transposase